MPATTGQLRDGAAEQMDDGFESYIDDLVHAWSKTVTALGFTLVPLFFILDCFILPAHLLARFAVYRLITTAVAVAQYFIIRNTRPSKLSLVHGYLLSFVVGGCIALMTTDLGGFNSTYYAGLNLVIIAIVVLLPWGAFHSALNSLVVIGLYVGLNLLWPSRVPVDPRTLINNIYFLTATGVIAVSINYVKQRLIHQEYYLRSDLRRARDALWSEMAVAKRIQTSLLPNVQQLDGYKVAATMLPAEEVGGDYYDVVQTKAGETWISIGDVSGHGVESGLIMMMTQTSIVTSVNQTPGLSPSRVLGFVNSVVRENIARLGTDRYMTVCAMALQDGHVVMAGKHQDVMLLRAATGTVEQVPTQGTWLGVVDKLDDHLTDQVFPVAEGDTMLLYSDGVTEATSSAGQMFGEDRLRQALQRHGHRDVAHLVKGILDEVLDFIDQQGDDITLLAVRRCGEQPLAADRTSGVLRTDEILRAGADRGPRRPEAQRPPGR